jgi:hypothetical protein
VIAALEKAESDDEYASYPMSTKHETALTKSEHTKKRKRNLKEHSDENTVILRKSSFFLLFPIFFDREKSSLIKTWASLKLSADSTKEADFAFSNRSP